MTLVIATGGVDLSVGAVIAIAGTVLALLVAHAGLNPWLAMLITLGAGLAAGLANGLMVAAIGIEPIVATLVLMVSGRGIAQWLSDGEIVSFNNPSLSYVGSGYLFGFPFPAVVTLAAAAATALFVRRTAAGLFIESSGDNPVAARICGIDVRTVKLFVYAVSGLFAAVAGILVASDTMSADAANAGLYYELDAILAVVIGGTSLTGGRFNLLGSLVGAALIQAVNTTILMKGIRPEFTLVVKAVAVVAVCLLQSKAFRQRIGLAAVG